MLLILRLERRRTNSALPTCLPVQGVRCQAFLGLSHPTAFHMGFARNACFALQVMSRVPGVTVAPHHARIEEKALDFYEQFHVIILGLDSLEARRYMNSVACSLLGGCSSDTCA